MTIHNLAEKNKFYDYSYPTQEGVFCGILMGAMWSKHSIIHTFWKLNDGSMIDCALFKDNRPKDIELIPDNAHAELTLVKLGSVRIYLRKIKIIHETENGGKTMIFHDERHKTTY